MLDVDTSHRNGIYRFRQDGASGRIFKSDAKGHATQTGTKWAVEIDGESNNELFDTKAEAEAYANGRTRAGWAHHGETETMVDALALDYSPLEGGDAYIGIRTKSGEFVRVMLNQKLRARLLRSLADDFASDVEYGYVTYKTEES